MTWGGAVLPWRLHSEHRVDPFPLLNRNKNEPLRLTFSSDEVTND